MKRSVTFYDTLLTFMGFKKVHDEAKIAGWESGMTSLWLRPVSQLRARNKWSTLNPGPNHIAFSAYTREDVDKLYRDCLKPNRVRVLYGGPGEQLYVKGYYAVYFLDPDGVKIEVMWLPPHPKHEH